jgi:hypothetical protein
LLPDERRRSRFLIASRGGENEMKKRIILIGLCFVLLLVFASSSYAGGDARYKLKADPWEEMNFCPAQDTADTVYAGTPNNSAAFVWVIEVLGNRLILVRGLNYILCPRTSDSRPSSFRER